MQILAKQGHIQPEDEDLYLHNRLALMVPRANPAGITSVNDLAGDNVRISQPDPENEDIAHHIINMYRQAGGNALSNASWKKSGPRAQRFLPASITGKHRCRLRKKQWTLDRSG
jgi:hypothetical protein